MAEKKRKRDDDYEYDEDDNEDDDDYVSSNKPLLSFRMVPVKSAHVDLNGPKALHRGDSWGLSTL